MLSDFSYCSGWCRMNEGNVLLNDALNAFYLWLYDVRHLVKDHSDSKRGNPLLPKHGLLFSICTKESVICTIPETLPLLYQSWSTEWNENYFTGSTMKDGADYPLHHAATTRS